MQEFDRKEARNGKIMGYVFLIAAIVCVVLTIAYIILGYVPIFAHLNNDYEPCDGLGRMLDDVPAAMSLILPQWAGHIWFIVDCLVLLAMVFLIDRLFVKSSVYFKGVKHVDF